MMKFRAFHLKNKSQSVTPAFEMFILIPSQTYSNEQSVLDIRYIEEYFFNYIFGVRRNFQVCGTSYDCHQHKHINLKVNHESSN